MNSARHCRPTPLPMIVIRPLDEASGFGSPLSFAVQAEADISPPGGLQGSDAPC